MAKVVEGILIKITEIGSLREINKAKTKALLSSSSKNKRDDGKILGKDIDFYNKDRINPDTDDE